MTLVGKRLGVALATLGLGLVAFFLLRAVPPERASAPPAPPAAEDQAPRSPASEVVVVPIVGQDRPLPAPRTARRGAGARPLGRQSAALPRALRARSSLTRAR